MEKKTPVTHFPQEVLSRAFKQNESFHGNIFTKQWHTLKKSEF